MTEHMEYRHVERLLKKWHRKDNGQFESAIFNLRKHRVVILSSPGKGVRTRYRKKDVALLHMSLLLVSSGLAPRYLANVMRTMEFKILELCEMGDHVIVISNLTGSPGFKVTNKDHVHGEMFASTVPSLVMPLLKFATDMREVTDEN